MKISWKEKAKYVLTNPSNLINGFFLFTGTGLVTALSLTPMLLKGYSFLNIFSMSFGFGAVITMTMGLHQIFNSKWIENYIQIDKKKEELQREKEKQTELEQLEKILRELYGNIYDATLSQCIKQTKELLQRIQLMTKEGVFSVTEEHRWTSTVPRDLTKLFVLFHRMDEENKKKTRETMKQLIENKEKELEIIHQRYQNQVKNDWDTVVKITESREIE